MKILKILNESMYTGKKDAAALIIEVVC